MGLKNQLFIQVDLGMSIQTLKYHKYCIFWEEVGLNIESSPVLEILLLHPPNLIQVVPVIGIWDDIVGK